MLLKRPSLYLQGRDRSPCTPHEMDPEFLRLGGPLFRGQATRLGRGALQALLYAMMGPGNIQPDTLQIEPDISTNFWGVLVHNALQDLSHFSDTGAHMRNTWANFEEASGPFHILNEVLRLCVDTTQRPASPRNIMLLASRTDWLEGGAGMVSPGWSADMRRLLAAPVYWFTDSLLAVGCSPDTAVIAEHWPRHFDQECEYWQDRWGQQVRRLPRGWLAAPALEHPVRAS